MKFGFVGLGYTANMVACLMCSNNWYIKQELAQNVFYSCFSIDKGPGKIVTHFISTPKNGCVSESGKHRGTSEVTTFVSLYSVLARAGCTALYCPLFPSPNPIYIFT